MKKRLHGPPGISRQPAVNKLGRPLEEIALDFIPQFASDDCLVVNVAGLLAEYGKRKGLDLGLPRERIKEICGYTGGFGSQSTRIAPNLGIHLRNLRLGDYVDARESQGDQSSLARLRKIVPDEATSFPIVSLNKDYWSVQGHAKVKPKGEMEHTVIVLSVTDDEVAFFDPFQRQRAVESGAAIHRMPTTKFTSLWANDCLASKWILWLVERAKLSTLMAYQEGSNG